MAVDEGVRSPDFTIHGVLPRLAGEAVAFIENHAAEAPGRPFFLYVPLTAPHLPVVVNSEYGGRSGAGDYGDFVVETDAVLGAILAVLDRTGFAESTLVLFTSDNGGLYHYWEPRETDDLRHYKVRGRAAHIREYAHQANAHLRGTKADVWEGGHRIPFIVRWPGKTPAGAVSDELIELTDLLAMSAAIVGAELPAGAGPDSRNILPALLSAEPAGPVRDFAVHHSLWGVFPIRQGPWKLIPHRGSGGFTIPRELDPAVEGGPPGQLYNLESDPSETRNVYEDHPEIVDRLTRLLESVQGDDA
jgi:arylsulfatase A-like enzyme